MRLRFHSPCLFAPHSARHSGTNLVSCRMAATRCRVRRDPARGRVLIGRWAGEGVRSVAMLRGAESETGPSDSRQQRPPPPRSLPPRRPRLERFCEGGRWKMPGNFCMSQHARLAFCSGDGAEAERGDFQREFAAVSQAEHHSVPADGAMSGELADPGFVINFFLTHPDPLGCISSISGVGSDFLPSGSDLCGRPRQWVPRRSEVAQSRAWQPKLGMLCWRCEKKSLYLPLDSAQHEHEQWDAESGCQLELRFDA
ncbi:hypothetical protein QBC34DRAFT_163760 [Podospora aff. communis PSN243]|uniref:Uncharacterized protein n=1 Tax=Podospora aff. communis PSN243 TaxID=3040156 RepID=A0AAV9GCK3_9PEZI|nr:hypothetical protein QBC34DRAFT_163760 [Podospora aff. communis PSN243]